MNLLPASFSLISIAQNEMVERICLSRSMLAYLHWSNALLAQANACIPGIVQWLLGQDHACNTATVQSFDQAGSCLDTYKDVMIHLGRFMLAYLQWCDALYRHACSPTVVPVLIGQDHACIPTTRQCLFEQDHMMHACIPAVVRWCARGVRDGCEG